MKEMRGPTRNSHGLSLIELMVAMFILSVVILFGLRFLMLQHRWIVQQEGVTDSLQQARAAMDLMSRELMLIGFGVPKGQTSILLMEEEEITFLSNLKGAMARLTHDTAAGANRLAIDYTRKSSAFRLGKTISICWKDRCEWNKLARPGGRRTLQLAKNIGQIFPTGSTVQVVNQVQYRKGPMKDGRSNLIRKVDKGASPVAERIVLLKFDYLDEAGLPSTFSEEVRRVGIHIQSAMPKGQAAIQTLHSEIFLRN